METYSRKVTKNLNSLDEIIIMWSYVDENNLDSSLGGDPTSYTLYPTIDMVPPPNVQTLSEKQIYLIQYNNILQSR